MNTVRLLLILFFSSSYGTYARELHQVIIEDCSPEEEELIRSRLLIAKEETQAMLDQVQTRLENGTDYSVSIKRKLQRTISVLKCSIPELYEAKYQCGGEKPNTYNAGWTLPFKGSTVKLYSIKKSGPVYLEQTLLHEATHHCKTSDMAYFGDSKLPFGGPPRDVKLISWPNIADSYAYWMRYGFCIPEKDC